MRKLVLSLFLMTIISSHALAETHYKVNKGKLHKGGKLSISSVISSEKFLVTLKYAIKKRALVPIPADKLNGVKTTELPFEFSSELGYIDLEKTRTKKVRKAKLQYLERTSYGRYTNAHKFLIMTDNGKSSSEVIYHPQAPGIGWVNIKIIFHSIGGYSVEAWL